MTNTDVSIVIVSMNNLENLFPCLNSIYNYNKDVSFEILVVAYLFSNENMCSLREKYPLVKIIESKEIRGFSENNNLALRKVHSPFCMILNDDTVMTMPVVDLLYKSFQKEPKASFFGPKILNINGTVQSCGSPPHSLKLFFFHILGLQHKEKARNKYTHKTGIFQTYNLIGAAFMVKTNVMKKLGCFDEKYFFCPEDIALTTLANKNNYSCYINADISIIHSQSGTSNRIRTAIFPAMRKGEILFYANNSDIKYIYVSFIVFIENILKFTFWFCLFSHNDRATFMTMYKNSLSSIFSKQLPKDIFLKYYKQILNN